MIEAQTSYIFLEGKKGQGETHKVKKRIKYLGFCKKKQIKWFIVKQLH